MMMTQMNTGMNNGMNTGMGVGGVPPAPMVGTMDGTTNNNNNNNNSIMSQMSQMNFGASTTALGNILNRCLACGRLSESSHPLVCVFHVLFKALALFFYVFGGWFAHDRSSSRVTGANFITVAVICILLLAADFWVVKNITGRLLVGLRWWNKVEGDTTQWIFESHDEQQQNQQQQQNDGIGNIQKSRYNGFDKTVFWWVLYITPLLWIGLLIIGILKFELGWLIIVFMALGLSFANVYGYYKCSNEQK